MLAFKSLKVDKTLLKVQKGVKGELRQRANRFIFTCAFVLDKINPPSLPLPEKRRIGIINDLQVFENKCFLVNNGINRLKIYTLTILNEKENHHSS